MLHVGVAAAHEGLLGATIAFFSERADEDTT